MTSKLGKAISAYKERRNVRVSRIELDIPNTGFPSKERVSKELESVLGMLEEMLFMECYEITIIYEDSMARQIAFELENMGIDCHTILYWIADGGSYVIREDLTINLFKHIKGNEVCPKNIRM